MFKTFVTWFNLKSNKKKKKTIRAAAEYIFYLFIFLVIN